MILLAAAQKLPTDFAIVLFLVSVGWILGGAYQAWYPERSLNFHRRFVPKNPWGLAVRLRIVSLQTFRIAGYIAVIGGIAGLGTLFWIMLHRVNV